MVRNVSVICFVVGILSFVGFLSFSLVWSANFLFFWLFGSSLSLLCCLYFGMFVSVCCLLMSVSFSMGLWAMVFEIEQSLKERRDHPEEEKEF